MFKFRLFSSTGIVQSAEAWETLPVEFFRAYDMVDLIYAGKDDDKKQAFSKSLLRRLNHEPWGRFDEVYPAARPPTASAFVGLEVFEQTYEAAYGSATGLRPVAQHVVYQYHPHDVL
jgi:hypothetical protein